MVGVTPEKPSFHPRHWSGWLAVGFFRLLALLPRRAGLAVGHAIGALAGRLMASRRRVVQRNLERCFPDRDASWREAVEKACFRSLGRAIVESAWCWSGAADRMLDRGTVEGLEHIQAAMAAGRGVLVVSGHFTCLEMGGRFMAEHVPSVGVYRRLRQPVLEWWHTRGRLRYGAGMIDQKDVRAMIRWLRGGGIIWYAPDQDFGPDQSLFVPFFDIPTATLLASHRLPKMTGCQVLFFIPSYDVDNDTYHLRFSPVLDDYPSDDPHADLARINAAIEDQVRRSPEQYWWVHRRFKTRPEGEPPFYG